MKNYFLKKASLMLMAGGAMFMLSNCNSGPKEAAADTAGKLMNAATTPEDAVEHGRYLVLVGGCNDCHSPKNFTDRGPVVDETRILSGHPAGSPLPKFNAADIKPGGWYLAGPDLTAWVGPWGISYTANLTPDSATGLGAWSEENFLNALRKGKHLGADDGRMILPPMPWQEISKMKDEDLKAIFAYLKSIPPIVNKVPNPVAPPDLAKL